MTDLERILKEKKKTMNQIARINRFHSDRLEIKDK